MLHNTRIIFKVTWKYRRRYRTSELLLTFKKPWWYFLWQKRQQVCSLDYIGHQFVSQIILKYKNKPGNYILFVTQKRMFPCKQNLRSSFLIMNALHLRAKHFSHKFGNYKLSPWFPQETTLSLISLGKFSRGVCGANALLLARIKNFSHKLSFRKDCHKNQIKRLARTSQVSNNTRNSSISTKWGPCTLGSSQVSEVKAASRGAQPPKSPLRAPDK